MPEMFQWQDTQPDLNIPEAEYLRLLGFPRHHPLTDRSRELADAARAWFREHGRPWIHAHQIARLEFTGEGLHVNGATFKSKSLLDRFAVAEACGAVLVAVSAGSEGEEHARQHWEQGKPDEYFFLEAFGSTVVEHLVMQANGRICAWADANGMAALPHYSPGYSGWDVADQVKLWGLIRPTIRHPLCGPLEVLDTGMLRPKKSLLAVIGLTRNLEKARHLSVLVPCEQCALPGCRYRRANYRHAPSSLEGMPQFGTNQARATGYASPELSPLRRDAEYSTNTRALRKWSAERLELTTVADGSIEALFRYEGTTCSNLGRPLEFHYHVRLTASESGFVIAAAKCAPAPGDTGHAQQCEYLNNPAALMEKIATEKPLLGRPLNDVLTWERTANPAGCYCDVESRQHKWGLVFEVIHFALAQGGKPVRKSSMQ